MANEYYVCDLEGDSLTPTKIHCLVATKDGKNFLEFTDYESMRDFLTSNDILFVGHNFAKFDSVVIHNLLDVNIYDRIIDTLFLSWYLFPERNRHGLAEWGEQFGISKPKVEDWVNLSTEEYLHRCREDVKINWKLWNKCKTELSLLYGSFESSNRLIRYLMFKAKCARLQELSGWKLDVEKTKEHLNRLEELKNEKVIEIEAVMPKVPIYKKNKPPSKPFKKDGSLSATGERWAKLCEEYDRSFDSDEIIQTITGYDEPNVNSHDQIKDWLYGLGWEPDEFKFTKNKKTGEIKKIPQVNKPFGAGLSDSVKLLVEKDENVLLLDGLFVLSHRISILKGFLDNVDFNGYLRAEIAGLTNTLRFKHSVIVNLPKPSNPYGKECRGVLIADEDEELCGSDMSSLEDRLKQHYMYPHDPDYVNDMNVPDFDPHIDLGVFAGMIDKDDAILFKEYKSSDNKENYGDNVLSVVSIVGKTRGIAKNGNYACQYGAGPPRLVLTTGISLEKATELHKAYWDRNWSVKAVAKEQVVKTVNGQMWLWNPIAQLWFSLRHDKDRFSTLVQGSASFCFDLWLGFVLSKREQLTGQFHDEFILCISKGHQDDCRDLLNWAIEKTNEVLQLNRRLDIDIQFGACYADIH